MEKTTSVCALYLVRFCKLYLKIFRNFCLEVCKISSCKWIFEFRSKISKLLLKNPDHFTTTLSSLPTHRVIYPISNFLVKQTNGKLSGYAYFEQHAHWHKQKKKTFWYKRVETFNTFVPNFFSFFQLSLLLQVESASPLKPIKMPENGCDFKDYSLQGHSWKVLLVSKHYGVLLILKPFYNFISSSEYCQKVHQFFAIFNRYKIRIFKGY